MNEFLQASFIAAGLTALLGVVLADDFYLKNGEIKGTGEERVANTKKWELLKLAWDKGEILEAMVLRFLQNIAVLPILFLLYQAEVQMSINTMGWLFFIMAIVLFQVVLNVKSVWGTAFGTMIFTGIIFNVLIFEQNIMQQLNLPQQFIIAVAYTIIIYCLIASNLPKERWEVIIRKFLAFEVKEWIITMLAYLILYKLDALPIWNISVGVKVLIIMAIVQISIPIYKVWGRVLE